MKTKKRKYITVRIPTPKPTIWLKDGSRYNRKRKHKSNVREDDKI